MEIIDLHPATAPPRFCVPCAWKTAGAFSRVMPVALAGSAQAAARKEGRA